MKTADYEEYDMKKEIENYLEDMKAEAEREKEAYREMAWRDWYQRTGGRGDY